jgi:hypothetical protein
MAMVAKASAVQLRRSVVLGMVWRLPNESRMSCGAALAGAPRTQPSPLDRWRAT